MARRNNKKFSDPLDIVYKADKIGTIDYDEYISLVKNFEINMSIAPFFMILVDLATRKVIYVTQSISQVLGYSKEEWMGIELLQIFKKYHPDSLVTQPSLFKTLVDFFKNINIRKRIGYSFSYNIQIKHKNNHYCHLLLNNRCIKYDSSGRPRLVLVSCFDMNSYISNNEQILTIYKITANSFKQVYKTIFYSEYERGILTHKEVEIWSYIQKGYTGKEIAELLNISIHTVNTHRKKIYKKLAN